MLSTSSSAHTVILSVAMSPHPEAAAADALGCMSSGSHQVPVAKPRPFPLALLGDKRQKTGCVFVVVLLNICKLKGHVTITCMHTHVHE